MRPLEAAILASALAISCAAGAVQLQGPGPGGAAAPAAPELVERGGTIMQVDSSRRQLLIDGVPWSITPATRIVFPQVKKGGLQAVELRPGDQVKFTTRRNGSTDDVVEILLVGRDSRFDRK